MADADDLPPRQLSEAPEQIEDGARSLGEMFGGLVWIALIVAIVGVVLFFFMRGPH